MTFIPLNLNDAVEQRPVPTGRYDLTIASCEEGITREKKTPQFVVQLSIDGEDKAPFINHYIGIPTPGEDAKKMEFKMLLLKRFCAQFGLKISADGFDTTQMAMEMVGAHCSKAEVTLAEPDEKGNVYNRLVTPRLKDEGNSGQAAGRVAPKPPKS